MSHPAEQFQNFNPPIQMTRKIGFRSPLVRAGSVVAVIVLLAGLAVTINRTIITSISGTSTPSAAVSDFMNAFAKQDSARMLALLAPDEMYQIAGVAKHLDATGKKIIKNLDKEFHDAVKKQPALKAIKMKLADVKLSTEKQTEELAKVTIDGFSLKAEIPKDTIKDISNFPSFGNSGIDITGYKIEFSYKNDLAEWKFTSDSGKSDSGSQSLAGMKFSLMTVYRTGGWYISPFFTSYNLGALEMQIGTNADVKNGIPKWKPQAVGESETKYSSPRAAAEGLARGIKKLIEKRDIRPLANALSGVESRFLRTYAQGINADLASESELAGDTSVNFDINVNSTAGRYGYALISLDNVKISGSAKIENQKYSFQAKFDGNCGKVNFTAPDTANGEDLPQRCLRENKFLNFLYSKLGKIVAVPTDGGWKLSYIASVFHAYETLSDFIGDVESKLLAAGISNNYSKFLAGRKSQGAFSIGSETMVDIKKNATVLPGGFAILDYSGSPGTARYVSCEENCTVLIIDSDGDIVRRGYTVDYSTRGYQIGAGAKLLVIGLEGKHKVTVTSAS